MKPNTPTDLTPPKTRFRTVLIVSGEVSGDQHGAQLVTAVCTKDSTIRFMGMGGDAMRTAGVNTLVDAKPLAVVGLIEIVRHIGPLYRAWKTLLRALRHQQPDLLVLIDYPKFNLMLAKKAKRAGIKVLYYISPQVWAWHRSRLKTIGKRVDKMLVVFPFEEPLYRERGIPVEYVGHPLADKVRPTQSPEQCRKNWQIPKGRVIGLLPGSRQGEVRRLLPVMLQTAQRLKQQNPDLHFILPLASSVSQEQIRPYLQGSDLPIYIIRNEFYNAVQLCDAVIVASGTATLEVALLGIPMVIVYKTATSTYFLAKHLIKIPYIGLCNIVAGKSVVKELIQQAANVENIGHEIQTILDNAAYRQKMIQELEKIKIILGQGGGSRRAADALITMVG